MSVCYKMKEKESYIEKQKDIFGDTTWFTYRYEVNGMVYETSAGSLDICRKARDKWMKMMSVAFTGHRTIRTNKYALSVSLNEEVRFCYENGIRFFYTLLILAVIPGLVVIEDLGTVFQSRVAILYYKAYEFIKPAA